MNDTKEHIQRVANHLEDIVNRIIKRAVEHDASKLREPELSLFERISPLLSEIEYGGDEYMAVLEDLKPAIDHHYRANRHHPEHFQNGVIEMNLIDIIEMLADWKAASERYPDRPFYDSLVINFDRFDIPTPLRFIIINTAQALGWIDHR